MTKNLFEVVQSLFIPFVLPAFVCAYAVRFDSEKLKRNFFKLLAFTAVLVLAVSFLREKRLIRYNQINNIYLLTASLVFGLGFAVLNWLHNPKLKALTAFTGLLFVACHLFYSIPIVFSLPFHFLGMYDTYFSTMYLAKCTGYLLGWLICALSARAVYKILVRSSEKVNSLVFSALYLISGFISFVTIVGIINSYYRRKIKIPSGLRKSLPQLITAENIIFFLAILVIAVLAVAFFVYHRKIHGEYTNPAEHRKLKARARNNRRQAAFTLFLCLLVWLFSPA